MNYFRKLNENSKDGVILKGHICYVPYMNCLLNFNLGKKKLQNTKCCVIHSVNDSGGVTQSIEADEVVK